MSPADQLERVYRAHFGFVWRSLRHLGVPERELPDATQDVFLVVHRKLDAFDGNAKMTTWLYAVCLRVGSDRRRRAHVRREILRESDPDVADAASDASIHVEQRQGRELLYSILDAMPPEQRAVFTLFEIEGVGREDIAEMLQIPPGTVASRLRLARSTFRRAAERVRAREAFDTRKVRER